MSQLTDFKLHTKLKLSLLWASTVFCYLYCDYFELYVPGKLDGMLQGNGLFGTVTQGALVATSVLLAIPSVLVFLSSALNPRASQVLNVTCGVIYTLLMALLAFQADWYFYKFFAALEALLTALVVWYAWTWPKTAANVA